MGNWGVGCETELENKRAIKIALFNYFAFK